MLIYRHLHASIVQNILSHVNDEHGRVLLNILNYVKKIYTMHLGTDLRKCLICVQIVSIEVLVCFD